MTRLRIRGPRLGSNMSELLLGLQLFLLLLHVGLLDGLDVTVPYCPPAPTFSAPAFVLNLIRCKAVLHSDSGMKLRSLTINFDS